MFANTTKVWIFIFISCLLILVAGYNLGDRLGLLIAFFVSLGFYSLFFFFGESKILHELHAQAVLGQDPWNLHSHLQKIAADFALPAPKVYLIDHPACTIFSLSQTLKSNAVGLTTGLLYKVSDEELKILLTYQVGLLKKSDSFLFSIINSSTNALIGGAVYLDSVSPWNWFSRNKKYNVFLNLIYPLGWLILKVALREKAFLDADQTAAQYTQQRYELSKLLWKLQGFADKIPLQIPAGTNHLFIVPPDTRTLYQVHPSIKKRINSLLGHYPA
ncbi:MAG: M48 family metalloprotease [Pseudobdellovibrionaceae bacterium]